MEQLPFRAFSLAPPLCLVYYPPRPRASLSSPKHGAKNMAALPQLLSFVFFFLITPRGMLLPLFPIPGFQAKTLLYNAHGRDKGGSGRAAYRQNVAFTIALFNMKNPLKVRKIELYDREKKCQRNSIGAGRNRAPE